MPESTLSGARPSGRFAWSSDGPILLLALLLPTLSTWLYFVVFAGQGHLPKLLYGGSKLLQALLPLAWVGWKYREELGWPVLNSASLVWGLAFGLFTFIGMDFVTWPWIESFLRQTGMPKLIEAKVHEFGVTTLPRFLLMALFLSTLHAAFEEYYWRWFVFGQLRKGIPWPAAVAISSLGFMSHHVLVLDAYLSLASYPWQNLALSFGVAVGGAAWAVIYQYTRSLLGPWLAHVFADLALMWIGFQMIGASLT